MDHFIPRDFSLREQDLIPWDDSDLADCHCVGCDPAAHVPEPFDDGDAEPDVRPFIDPWDVADVNSHVPCPYRLPDRRHDFECWSGNCRLAAAELECSRLRIGVPFAIIDHVPPEPSNERCPHCGFVDVPDHRWRCRWTRLMCWLFGR